MKLFSQHSLFISSPTSDSLIPLVISPIGEELLFRGVLLEFLLRKRFKLLRTDIAANIAVSLLFTALHLIVRGELFYAAVFFPSLLLGWHYCRYRAIIPVILAHAAYNLSIY
jgi:membrane protease YdiL (CAAX protease family)